MVASHPLGVSEIPISMDVSFRGGSFADAPI